MSLSRRWSTALSALVLLLSGTAACRPPLPAGPAFNQAPPFAVGERASLAGRPIPATVCPVVEDGEPLKLRADARAAAVIDRERDCVVPLEKLPKRRFLARVAAGEVVEVRAGTGPYAASQFTQVPKGGRLVTLNRSSDGPYHLLELGHFGTYRIWNHTWRYMWGFSNRACGTIVVLDEASQRFYGIQLESEAEDEDPPVRMTIAGPRGEAPSVYDGQRSGAAERLREVVHAEARLEMIDRRCGDEWNWGEWAPKP